MRLAAVLTFGALVGGAASAQEPPATGQERDVVIVTGVGPARTGGELIASTTALEKDDVIDNLGGGLGDTLERLPGVTSTAFGPGASRPVIRGLGAERVQVLTNGIGVVDASAASPDHAVTGDPLGAERIEILRGPASLAYGGGASGGVVNVIDGLIAEEAPAAPLSADGYAGYTSADEGGVLALHAEGAAGALVGVVSASQRDSDDLEIPRFAESARLRALEEDEGEEHDEAFGTLPNSFVDSHSLSAGLSLVNDSGFVGVSVRRLDSQYGIVGGHEHEEGGEEEAPETPFIDMEQMRYDLRGGWRFADGPLVRVAGALSVVDYEHTEFEGPGEPGTMFNNDGFETRLEAEHAEIAGLSGSIGVQASRRDFAAVGDEAFVSPTVTEQAGVFVFETFEQGDWGLEGGLRYDRVELDNAAAGGLAFDTLNASFGAHGHVTDSLFLGASVSRTERAPTDVELFANGPHLATRQFEVGDASLKTERGVNLELSARWEAGPLKLGGSVYRFDFEDFIYLDPTGAEMDGLPVFQAVQDDATFAGAELTAEIELGEALGVIWRGDAAVDNVRAELSGGGRLPRIPPASASLGLEGAAGMFSARLEARWADAQDRVTDFELPTDSWTTLGLRAKAQISERVSLIVEGTNLTDEEVRIHASPLKDVAPMAGRGFRIGLRAGF